MLTWLIVVIAWLLVGAIGVVALRRRGHELFQWTFLFAVLGPLAVPVAVQALRRSSLTTGSASASMRNGTLDVLVADDGSARASAALDSMLTLLGPSVTSVSIATVLDHEAATTVRGRETLADAQARVERFADRVRSQLAVPVDSVILYGEPARALHEYAAANSYELLVAGAKGAGMSRSVLGSVARSLVGASPVPVLIGPDGATNR